MCIAPHQVQSLPKAALLLATSKAAAREPSLLAPLAAWAPGSAAQGLQLLSVEAGQLPPVRSYAIRCLFNERPEKVARRPHALCLVVAVRASSTACMMPLPAAAGAGIVLC